MSKKQTKAKKQTRSATWTSRGTSFSVVVRGGDTRFARIVAAAQKVAPPDARGKSSK